MKKKLSEPGTPPRAIRLSFSIDGNIIKLVHEHYVEMTVFPSEDLKTDKPRTAFWFDVRDKEGIPLYRGFARNPLDPWIEVSTGDKEKPLAFRKTEKPENFFSLAVPDLYDAHSVALFGFKPSKPGADLNISKPPAEIARFLLTRVHGSGTDTNDLPASFKDNTEV